MKAVTVIVDDDGARRVVHSPDMTIPEVTDLLHMGIAMTAQVAMHEVGRDA